MLIACKGASSEQAMGSWWEQGMEKVIRVVAWVPRVKNLMNFFLKTAVIDGEKDALAIFSQG